MLYRHFNTLSEEEPEAQVELTTTIEELIAIAEYSAEFPICLWIYGDAESKAFMNEKLSELPPMEHIQSIINLPHIKRLESEALGYAKADEKLALKRFRKEQASFNKQRKNSQRTNS
ncbi:hypothetical protein ACFPK9_15870 [Rubritalea spongiae]